MSLNKVNPLNRAVDKAGGGGAGGASPSPTISWSKFFSPRKNGKHKFFTCE